MPVHHRVLPSGLELWLSPNPEEPRIVARVVVRAGSAYDPRDQTGVAHQLEHVAANKGGARLRRGEVKALVGLLGGIGLNAFTGADRTSYLVNLPSSRLAAWASIEADRMAAPVTEDGFASEMEVIREEKRKPHLRLHNEAEKCLAHREIRSTHLSLTHEREYSVAMVVLEK